MVSTTVSAQCTFRNTAFKSGEFLTYNLYYNWKFVWVKAGTASMSIVQTTKNGRPAYRTSLVTRGNKKVDDFFVNSINALLKGFEPVVIEMEDLMHQLEELPPMDESSFKAKINDIVAGYTKGKDTSKLRIVVKRKESED